MNTYDGIPISEKRLMSCRKMAVFVSKDGLFIAFDYSSTLSQRISGKVLKMDSVLPFSSLRKV